MDLHFSAFVTSNSVRISTCRCFNFCVNVTTTAEKKQTKAVKKVKATYSLKILDGSLAVINNKTKEVFEYTDMKKENLPADIKNMLKENVIFENREEVYHFLESYSS